MKTKKWTYQEIGPEGRSLGTMEFEDNYGQYHDFDLVDCKDKIIFGGCTNTGMLQSGYILKEDRTLNETLQELLADLECFYNDGPGYVSDIVVNDRM